MGKTSTQAKDKYNEATYARYTVRVRKDSPLYEQIEAFRARPGVSLNHVITKLLDDYFDFQEADEEQKEP